MFLDGGFKNCGFWMDECLKSLSVIGDEKSGYDRIRWYELGSF